MLVRKYLAFIPSTWPCICICLATWFLDRLFVEFGHRSEYQTLCTHSDLQYVQMHQLLTAIATILQIIWSVRERRMQFKREAALMGLEDPICAFHIYILQTFICISWTTVVVTLFDVSPWLCIDSVAQNRASLALLSLSIIGGSLPVEAYFWDRHLQIALRDQSGPIDI